MKLKILQAGHPTLRQKAKELTVEEILSPRIQQLIGFMKETMYDAPGVGLAAPQIGESLQLIVMEDKEEEFKKFLTAEQIQTRDRRNVPYQVLINPKLTIVSPEADEFYEGCLSVAGFIGLVPRALNVSVACLDENAQPLTIQATGWHARILQHECDHLQGVLCIDHMNMRSLSTMDNFMRYWKQTAR